MMSYEAQNRAAVVSYLQSGAKGDASLGSLGVEVEHFVVDARTSQAVPYEDPARGFGVRDVLEQLACFYPEKSFGHDGDLIGLSSSEASLSLEPAAQLEISIAPFSSIAAIVEVYERFRSRVDPLLAQHGCMLVCQGYHPTARALDLPLIPKQRYRYMNDYFHVLGTRAERMMRASASTQVSVDYRDEADAVRKMRVAQALAVVLASLADNAPVFEGSPAHGPLARMGVWRDVDDARCGTVPGLFDEGFGFETYADWLLGTCPIFVTRPAADDPMGPALRSVAGISAAEAYADAPMADADIEHLMSMFWPDVRLKRFVEIRPADSLPVERMAGYAALIKGLFYSEESLAAIEEAFGAHGDVWPLDGFSTRAAFDAVREQGDAARFAGRTLAEWKRFVLDVAHAALEEDERGYLDGLMPSKG